MADTDFTRTPDSKTHVNGRNRASTPLTAASPRLPKDHKTKGFLLLYLPTWPNAFSPKPNSLRGLSSGVLYHRNHSRIPDTYPGRSFSTSPMSFRSLAKGSSTSIAITCWRWHKSFRVRNSCTRRKGQTDKSQQKQRGTTDRRDPDSSRVRRGGGDAGSHRYFDDRLEINNGATQAFRPNQVVRATGIHKIRGRLPRRDRKKEAIRKGLKTAGA